MERIHIIVHGKVQGVGFRYHTRLQASQFELTGYVQNRPDGTVEIVAEGPPQSLEQFVTWTHQGPPAATVMRVDVTRGVTNQAFSDFVIKR